MNDGLSDVGGRADEEWAAAERDLLLSASVVLEYQLARARTDRDRAVLALERIRSRRSLRAVAGFEEHLRRAKRLTRPVRRRSIGSAAPAAAARAEPERSTHGTPAEFRERFLDRLERGALRFGVQPPTEGAAPALVQAFRATLDAIERAGWELGPVEPGVDVALLFDSSIDIHRLARGPVLVAPATDHQTWPHPASLADVDLVLVPDETVATAIEAAAAVRTVVVTVDQQSAATSAGPVPWHLSAASLTAGLRTWASGFRVGIAIGIPQWDEAESWGDLHFARALQRQLELRGHATRLHLLHEWGDAVSARDDAVIHLFGLRARPALAGQWTVLWVISHPDRVTEAMLDAADHVYVASDRAAEAFGRRTNRPVAGLHQATDPDRFRFDPTGPAHEVLFVGNTRGVRRRIIDQLVPTTFDLAVYGQGWEGQFQDSSFVRGDHVPNAELNRYYGAAGVVLNDHWPDMRAAGLLSNRLYDALASGAFLISDSVAGMADEFDGAVIEVESAGQLRWAIRDHLASPETRRRLAERGQKAVLGRHTFGHRVDRILSDLRADLGTPLAQSR